MRHDGDAARCTFGLITQSFNSASFALQRNFLGLRIHDSTPHISRNHKALDHLSILQVTFNNFIHIVVVHHRVPNTFWIHHRHGAACTAIQATRFIHARTTNAGKACSFNLRFAVVKRFLRTVVGAAILAVVSLIQAEKNVVFVVRGLSHE